MHKDRATFEHLQDYIKLEILGMICLYPDFIDSVFYGKNTKEIFKKRYMEYTEITEEYFQALFAEGIPEISMENDLFETHIIISIDPYGDNDKYANTLGEFDNALNELRLKVGIIEFERSSIDYEFINDESVKVFRVIFRCDYENDN